MLKTKEEVLLREKLMRLAYEYRASEISVIKGEIYRLDENRQWWSGRYNDSNQMVWRMVCGHLPPSAEPV